MTFTLPKIMISGLNDAPCGLYPKIEELKRINAMRESLNAATKYLNTCGRFYLHRVKNNLIDKLE